MTADLHGVLGQAAGVVSLLGFVPYSVDILRRKTRPNRATWWIWTVVGGMLCATYYAAGARHTVWVALSYVVGPVVIALLSLRYGEGGANRIDRTCLGASLLSLAVWWLARSPVMALAVNVAIDFCGAVPTLRACYHRPESESLSAWTLFLLADALNLGAMGSWSVSVSVYPTYLFLLATVLVLLMLRPRRARGAVASSGAATTPARP